ncbi:SMI1/KNR4 family protein [uncultured Tenacibaculum sp.]|uniref:SMI1/KNR4 family protein n=1 Tax=uncultured Tenacibaculum sp. TaxID=174713 RepID=UPI00260BD3C4|nr:SMI1/KNR4 family protein [uncultured Tenacibaculum sp.]
MKILSKYILIILLLMSCNSITDKNNSTERSKSDIEMQELIRILKDDLKYHENINSKITNQQINKLENDMNIKLPDSYKVFLQEFGNGAESLYHIDQPINGINIEFGAIHWIGKFRKKLGKEVPSDGFGIYKKDSLLCLMTENSNGGAWVWLTSQSDENGEWPLAFYNIKDGKLYYKVNSFKEWIRIATKCKNEVIRELDKKNKLGLG